METKIKNTNWGFSTLMALATISILLIIVTGVATVFINEMKLSRTIYDDFITSVWAEWIFEYGMLKVRNHASWFQDSIHNSDPDGEMFRLHTLRSENLAWWYTIISTSTGKIFDVGQNEHLIIPLYSSKEGYLVWSVNSKKPERNYEIQKSEWLVTKGMPDLQWTIVAQSGSESIWLNGSGNIHPGSIGIMREREADCYDESGNKLPNCFGEYAEMLEYFIDTWVQVSEFLGKPEITSPYLIIYNQFPKKEIYVETLATTPFSLPYISIEAWVQKNSSSKIYRFSEDKSSYLETLKYGIYNNESN